MIGGPEREIWHGQRDASDTYERQERALSALARGHLDALSSVASTDRLSGRECLDGLDKGLGSLDRSHWQNTVPEVDDVPATWF